MDDKNYEDEKREYDMLKQEISEKIQLDNTLTMFTVTTATAIMAFALSKQITILYLAPFCVLIPMSIRITYYRLAMSKLAAYLIVFLEDKIDGYKWETMNAKVMKRIFEEKKKLRDLKYKKKNYYFPLKHWDCMILSIAYTVMTVFRFYTMKHELIKNEFAVTLFVIVVMFICDGIELYLTYRMNSVDKEKETWKNRWQELKDELNVSTKIIDNNV